MFDLTINEANSDRELLIRVLKGLHAMSLDLSNVNAALTKLDTDVGALITADAAVTAAVAAERATNQSQVEGLVPSIQAISAKAEAVLNPPVADAAAPAA